MPSDNHWKAIVALMRQLMVETHNPGEAPHHVLIALYPDGQFAIGHSFNSHKHAASLIRATLSKIESDDQLEVARSAFDNLETPEKLN